MTNFIKLHRVSLITEKPIPHGDVLVNIEKIVIVERAGEFTKIAVTGDEGYFFITEDFDEIERKIGIFIDDIPANLWFKSGGTI